jgi:hypothetical protein
LLAACLVGLQDIVVRLPYDIHVAELCAHRSQTRQILIGALCRRICSASRCVLMLSTPSKWTYSIDYIHRREHFALEKQQLCNGMQT